MNMQKLLLTALLGAAISAMTTPTIGKVLGFGHSHAYAQSASDDDSQGDNDLQGENDDGQ